ncbi:MAG: hypothetical protein HRU12_23975, partial [Phaeodactylibacter sp.]|nr:hypothetical protein [Phaeodactylibacter sp.]
MKRSLLRSLKRLDRLFVRIGRTLQEWLGKKPTWPILIMPYRGYGGKDWISLRGRVIKDRRIIKDEVNSTWQALINNYKRFNSREVIGAKIRITVGQQTFIVKTDEEGYFFVDRKLDQPLPQPEKLWHSVKIHLRETPRRVVDVHAEAPLLVPHPEASIGCI